MTEQEKKPAESLGRFEIGFGTLVFVYATLLEPDVLFGLWPLLLLMLGPIFVLGGASLLKGWRWPAVAHIPLVLWIGVAWYLLN